MHFFKKVPFLLQKLSLSVTIILYIFILLSKRGVGMAYKKWEIAKTDKQLAYNLAEDCDIDPFIALIASSRGYTDPAEIEELLSNEPLYSSPYELPDMEKAVDAIKKAINEDTLLCVFGDYDCDGITATALLYDCIKSLGARVVYYIPDRFMEGYGMNTLAVDKLYAMGVGMIITVDNGISSAAEIEYAASLGIKTVVTDHHLPPEILPNAEAVVNPHRKDSNVEFRDISGVFVAFKLACALTELEPEQLAPKYADLVAIGLIADVMPLKHENRDIVKQGIFYLNNTSKQGIVALLNSAGIGRGSLNASRVAFGICPRINAAGRMDNASVALELLLSRDFGEACDLASKLEGYNSARQTTEHDITAEALEIIGKKGYEYDKVIVVLGEDWHKGVMGIVASRLVDKFGKPAIVLSVDENGEVTGSGRSVEGFSLYNAIVSVKDLLTKFGGHDLAAGVSLKREDVDNFRKEINAYAENCPTAVPTLKIECKLNPAGLSVDIADALQLLEPYGSGNPVPVFALCDLKIEKITSLANNKHIKLLLSKGETRLEALAFGVPSYALPFTEGDLIDIAVTVDANEYGGRRSLSLVIKNWRVSGLNEDKFFGDIDLYEKYKRQEKAMYDIPSREEIGEIYRVAANGISAEMLRQKFSNTIGYFKTMVSADILNELKLTEEYEENKIQKIRQIKGARADLSSSQILQFLKG